ncbi:hypothetical protein GCM10011400_51980 [Paraburkholderia caffeinilytica]|uniref:Uncharacterized protein n=1 Tax=Paraburkholderia caffeinilytica TaxID=1761016 RepID=A0ABQ1N7Q9_9BURK|nr:hypothetical protein GCM10011400_51980 [Paraburkholderia caffeinilytica]CAB3804905.1 hypothetical protein LMG28690_06139 [Paraburkholderia caffeinilytica]
MAREAALYMPKTTSVDGSSWAEFAESLRIILPSDVRIRPLVVVENGAPGRQIGRIWVQPSVDVLRLDRDNAAIMTGRRDFWRQLVSNRSKRPEVRFVRYTPGLF